MGTRFDPLSRFEVIDLAWARGADQQAADLLGRCRRLPARPTSRKWFGDILHRVRTEHGRNRN